jgi:hypothetical protein
VAEEQGHETGSNETHEDTFLQYWTRYLRYLRAKQFQQVVLYTYMIPHHATSETAR